MPSSPKQRWAAAGETDGRRVRLLLLLLLQGRRGWGGQEAHGNCTVITTQRQKNKINKINLQATRRRKCRISNWFNEMFQFFTFLIKIAGLQSFKKFDMLTRNDEIFKLFPHPHPQPTPPTTPYKDYITGIFIFIFRGRDKTLDFCHNVQGFPNKREREKIYIWCTYIYICLRHTILILVQTNSSSD